MNIDTKRKHCHLRIADGPVPLPPSPTEHLALRLHPEDFETHRQEAVTQTCLVLMLDMSGSMDRNNKFLAAKKVALAMEQLIRSQFPQDR